MKMILPTKIQGFSLLEALIAALVVAVAMLGLAQIQSVALLDSGDSRMKTHALNLAQEKIEELRTFANQNRFEGYAGASDTATGANAAFTRTWTITDCAALPTPCSADLHYKQVNARVTWVDPKGATQTVQLTSNIAQSDPVKSGLALLNYSGSSSSSSSSGGTGSSSTSSSSTSSTSSSTSSSSTGSSSSTSSTSSSGSTSSTSSSGGTSSTSSSSSSSGGMSSSGGGGACSGLVTAAIVTGSIEGVKTLKLGAEFQINTNPLAVCTVISVNVLNSKKGTYICSIQDLDPAIVALDVGGQKIDLSVNLALSDIPLPPLVSLLSSLLKPLNLPPDLVCVKANVNLPVKINGSGKVTIQSL